jgi:hypothetical protein
MKFIIWDARDGEPQRNEQGEFLSAGLIGVVGPDNAYISIYANYDDDTSAKELKVGQFAVARFNLSGSSGIYRVYRVE